MSARITPRPKAGGTHGSALEAAFGPCAHQVYRIFIEQKRPPDTWREVDNLDVANDPDSPVPPGDLVEETLSYMRNEQDAHGPAKFRVTAYGKKEDGSEVRLFVLDTGIDPPATDDQRKTQETSALVDGYVQLRQQSAEQHRQYIELLKMSLTVPATFVEVVKSIPENLRANTEFYQYKGKALELMFADKKEERASAERIETERVESEARERMFAKLVAKLEPLAEMWLLKIMADAGIDPATVGFAPGADTTAGSDAKAGGKRTNVRQEPSKKAETIKVFCKSLTDDEKTKIILALDGDGDGDAGGDALAVLFGAGNAPTDQACEACLRRLKEMLAGRDTMWIAMTLKGIVGDRVVPLIPILKPIWEEK